MMFSLGSVLSVVTFGLGFTATSVLGFDAHGQHLVHKRHLHGLNFTTRALEKRFDNARFSFFDPGLGACGGFHTNADFIVALNTPQWDGGSHCFASITISFRGKTTQAQIVDRCVECPPEALDFSRGLFDFFGHQDEGYLYGSWWFGAAPVTTTAQPTPSTTSTPAPTSTSSVASSASASSSAASSASSAIPTSIEMPGGFIGQSYLAFVQAAGLVVAAGSAQ